MKIVRFSLLIAVCTLFFSLTSMAAVKTMPDKQLFDPVYYAQTYPDVAAVFGNNETLLYQHYKLAGQKEGRRPYAPTAAATTATTTAAAGNFDPVYYAQHNPDVVAVLGNDPIKLYTHYQTCGAKEGRLGAAPAAAVQTPVNNTASTGQAASDTSKTETYKWELTKDQYKRVEDRYDSYYKIGKSFLSEVNDARKDEGRKSLSIDTDLSYAATILALEMDDNSRESSTRPNGQNWSSVFKQMNITNYGDCKMLHAKNSTEKIEKLVDEFLEDSSDYKELTRKTYRYFGMGHSGKYWVIILTEEA